MSKANNFRLLDYVQYWFIESSRETKTFTPLQYITLNIYLICRVFIDERKTQQNRQERRREKVKKTHESQMSELKRCVQNVRIYYFSATIPFY